jgi:hypothetical protein
MGNLIEAKDEDRVEEAWEIARCIIDNPHFCLGARCQLFGVCDYNRRLDGRPLAQTGVKR